MKDEFFLSEMFPAGTFDDAKTMIEADTEIFSQLVILSGLNPQSDLKHQNFDEINLNDSDIRGFNFTGCSMRGVVWGNCIKDETTVFTDATFDNEIPPEQEMSEEDRARLKAVLGLNNNEQVVWLLSIKRGNADYSQKLGLALSLFYSASDDFVKRTALETFIRHDSVESSLDVLKPMILTGDRDGGRVAFELLLSLVRRDRKRVLNFAGQFLNSPHYLSAAIFYVTVLDVKYAGFINTLSSLVERQSDEVGQRLYLRELASRFGVPFVQSIRHPVTGDIFTFRSIIDDQMIEKIARRISNRMLGLNRTDAHAMITFMDMYGPPGKIDDIGERVKGNIRKMSQYGAKYQHPPVWDEFLPKMNTKEVVHRAKELG